MAVSPAVIKAIVVAATDKRTWIFIGSIICGVILMIVGIVAAFLNIFSFDDSGTATASTAYVQFINNMKYAYGRLDAAIEETCPSLDREQIHAVFYTLYFSEEKNKSENLMLHCGNPIQYASIDSNYWASHLYGFGRLPLGE